MKRATPCNGEGSVIERYGFGQLPDGRHVDAYRIVNVHGIEMHVISYGGIIVSLRTPDKTGSYDDIVLGFDALEHYLSTTYRQANPYFGAVIGRYGNRIAHGRFSLKGEILTLATNDGKHHLHGGKHGFDQALWQITPFENEVGSGVTLIYSCEDGEEGYPGRLDTQVTYTLTHADELMIDYRATTTKTTPVNLTQHSYFNLKGEGNGSILDHRLKINATAFTPVDEGLIPLGEIRPVTKTPFDFTKPTAIGERIGQDNSQLRGLGYDHNFVLARDSGHPDSLMVAAQVWEPDSGRLMTVSTTEPGLQFYSGNFLDGSLTGKSGRPYTRHSGFALETQHFPNSPNQENFPSTLLEPGDIYRSRTVYTFSINSDYQNLENSPSHS